MIKFINNNSNLEAQVKAIVKQSFPAASPSVLTLLKTEPNMRGGKGAFSTSVSGSNKQRFVWGQSLMGGSNVVG